MTKLNLCFLAGLWLYVGTFAGCKSAGSGASEAGAGDGTSFQDGPAATDVSSAGETHKEGGSADIVASPGTRDAIDKTCRSNSDCRVIGDTCLSPGVSVGCGICFRPDRTCSKDDECTVGGAVQYCGVPNCSCSGEKSCVSGCVRDDDCNKEAQEWCGPDHRCKPKVCLYPDSSKCPPNFACESGSNSTCMRKPCTKDSECAGACVNGKCYPGAGVCSPPAA